MSSDLLSQFEREDRIAGTTMLISLHDIVERRVPVHWDEAVAIVEEFCDVAIANSGETAAVPDLGNVLIGSDGHVTLGRTWGDQSPTAAGRMLHSLLSNGDVPVPLRLFVTQSTGHDTHQSLQEFARGLAYFGKPVRQQLIQDVYTRCAQAERVAAPVPPPLPIHESEAAKESDRQHKNPKHRWSRKRVFAAAAVVLAGSAAWQWRSGHSADDVQGSAARMLSGAAAVLTDLGEQVRNTLSPPTVVPTAAAAQASDSARRPTPKRRPPSSSADTSDAERKPLVSRQVSLPKSAGGWQLSAAVPSTVGFEPEAVYEEPAAPAAPSALYSSADVNVEPPVLISPHLTQPLSRPGASGGTVNRMVVVVSPEGTVERVQLVEGPARMIDMMLLSGAKTWRFTPALKDGEPVRYRTVISWEARP